MITPEDIKNGVEATIPELIEAGIIVTYFDPEIRQLVLCLTDKGVEVANEIMRRPKS